MPLLSDKELKKKYKLIFPKQPEKFYPVGALKQLGYERKSCQSCKRFFWAADQERAVCGDPACCGGFSFIGNTPAKNSIEYIDLWKRFSKILTKSGYIPIGRYPVTARWRDDLFFVQASIDDFIPYVINGEAEPIANPLIVPQTCLRFNDIDNVGITWAHYTCFIMVGQHRFEPPARYDMGLYLNDLYQWFIQGLGLKQQDIIFHEDVWAGSGNFGPCIEFFSNGLELANQVYMQYRQTEKGYADLRLKVLDMGLGYERNVWFSQGTGSSYETSFPTVTRELLSATGLKPDQNMLSRFLPYSGILNIDEVDNVDSAWDSVAKRINAVPAHLKNTVLPLSALYSIAEHTRSLLVAITDGALPSNIGGGYNLRVLLRRCFSFMDRYKWDIDLVKLCELHANYLRPLFPELKESLGTVQNVFDLEKKRFFETKEKTKRIVSELLRERIDEQKFLQLYDSYGIQPEMIKDEAEKAGKPLAVPDNFYAKVSELHEKEESRKKPIEIKLELKGVPETKLLFHEDQNKSEFTAKVLKAGDKFVVLDRTYFYPEGGGQHYDTGHIEKCRVYNVQKQDGMVIHFVDKPAFAAGSAVRCRIDMERRKQLSQHHTAIHLVNAAARTVLGSHVFQAGSSKTMEKAHIDITHYKALTEEEIGKIEEFANRMAEKNLKINVQLMKRNEAEKMYGMRIYQGGAVPGREIRIVSVAGLDTEACGGLHLESTGQAGRVIVIGNERIQDGINRITIKAGAAAEDFISKNMDNIRELIKLLNESGVMHLTPGLLERLQDPKRIINELRGSASVFNISVDQLIPSVKRFLLDISENRKKLGMASIETKQLDYNIRAETLKSACESLFLLWKEQKKELERVSVEQARMQAAALMAAAKENKIFEIVQGDRKDMINVGNILISQNPNLRVVLCNTQGDIIGLSKKEDMGQLISKLCQLAGGTGGGKKEFAQGRVELSKIMKIMPMYR